MIFLLLILKKLMPNFSDKEKYILHYENLQLYLRLELKLKQIHCVLKFKQSQWLKSYGNLTRKKKKKKKQKQKNGDKDWKALYRFMDNAVYGTTIENLRNKIDVQFIKNEKDYLK